MGDRLNQYQRRQANKKANAIAVATFFLTALLFGVGYLFLNNTLTYSAYQEVLASSGTLTLDQVQIERLPTYVIAFFVVWVVLALFMLLRANRKHNTFEFGEPELAQEGLRERKAINLHKLTPREFEEQVAQFIAMQGYRTSVVGGAGDRGVDIKVYNGQGQLVGVVQCKRYSPRKALPPMFVREMATVKQMHNVNIAYLATTAYFTNGTRRDAEKLGVRLIDGHDLKHIAKKRLPPNKRASAPPAQQPPIVAYPAPSNDPNARFQRPPQDNLPARKPLASFPPSAYDSDARVQQQLQERKNRLNKP